MGKGIQVKHVQALLKKSYNKSLSDHEGYKVDRELSGRRAQVYHNEEQGKSVVVHRGTDSIQDWGTNIAMSFGIKGKRYKHAKKVQRQAEEKYGKDNLITLGHSQGGQWAEKLGQGTSQVITLNKPTVPADIVQGHRVGEHQTDIKTSGDPVSVLRGFQKGNKAKVIQSEKGANPISEHSTDTLSRLPSEKVIPSASEKPSWHNGAVHHGIHEK